jgi:hypothetical protein
MNSSIAAAIQSAGAKMSSAADSIATGNLDGYVDASTQMSEAKLTMGIAAKLAQTERAMFKSTLDMLV